MKVELDHKITAHADQPDGDEQQVGPESDADHKAIPPQLQGCPRTPADSHHRPNFVGWQPHLTGHGGDEEAAPIHEEATFRRRL